MLGCFQHIRHGPAICNLARPRQDILAVLFFRDQDLTPELREMMKGMFGKMGVKLAEPYKPLPPEIKKHTDIFVIYRTWNFEITGLTTSD